MSGITPEIPNRLPLAIQPENRGYTTGQDAKLVNAYIERQPDGSVWIYERPGLAFVSQPSGGAAVGRGMYLWVCNDGTSTTKRVFSIFGNKLYKDNAVVPGAGNVLDTTRGVYRFQECLGATPTMIFGNGVATYVYNPIANTVTLIADPDFPVIGVNDPEAVVKGFSYLDGVMYVMRWLDAGIQGSADNNPASWNPLNVIIAQIGADRPVAIASQLTYVLAMKSNSIEVFYDANNSAGSALGRNEGALCTIGCAHEDSVQEIDGILIWLSSTKEGGTSVWAMSRLAPFEIATDAVKRLLQGVWTPYTVYSWVLKINGHRFYGITVTEFNITLVYDLDQKFWSQWTDSSGNYFPIAAWGRYYSEVTPAFQGISDGNIYSVQDDTASDGGLTTSPAIQVDLYTPNFDAGVRREKFLQRLEVISDQRVGAKLGIRFNDADYDPTQWTEFRYVDLSDARPYLDDCGSFYRRITNFRFRSATVRMPRLKAVELQMALGTL